ncbi:BolA family protein [Candidimonas nitroreducens]|uniref:BolA family transcriptional regulator n=1 Tax=Candidimonas nitroreducens TaxID=683354 RepID=A0A225M5S7_9BURK|nr:BolA family protein [Candidimonas nitroreducens]OWT56687.1 BolA family transcriptional regulator [Candidimonas nitroreducens]
MSTELMDTLRGRLAALEPQRLEIIDESHLHAGHAGSRGGARHFRVIISSAQFAGLAPVARHRLVYDRVQDLMPHPIHALAIVASTA